LAKLKETELAEAVITWLEEQYWDVYQEVQVLAYGGVADIVAVQNHLVWVIECKTSLTWTVIEQAKNWRSHFRSIAVPTVFRKTHSGRHTAYYACRKLFKIGVLEIGRYHSNEWNVNEVVPAPLMREYHHFAKHIRESLKPEHKTYARAGSRTGGHLTPYKATINVVKRFIKNNPGCTLTEIMAEDGRWHYASNKSARSSIRTALETFEADWCRVDKSVRPWQYYVRKDKET
jgi:hypothetical protein